MQNLGPEGGGNENFQNLGGNDMRVSSLGGSEKSNGTKSILGGESPCPPSMQPCKHICMLDVYRINCYVNMKHRPV